MIRTRILALLLAAVIAAGLAACSDESSQSPADTAAAAEADDSREIPEAVGRLSKEDEILLNGELKNGVYVNRYFGFKLCVPENGTLIRDNDGAEDTEEMISFRQAYEDGWEGIYFTASMEGTSGGIDLYITALQDDETGLTEKELVEKHIEDIKKVNRIIGDDNEPEYRTITLAGEGHPAAVSIYQDVPKSGFQGVILNTVSLSGDTTAVWKRWLNALKNCRVSYMGRMHRPSDRIRRGQSGRLRLPLP